MLNLKVLPVLISISGLGIFLVYKFFSKFLILNFLFFLLIRTGNTCRLSNFLLWQIAYTEIYFEKKLWPDFNEKDYNKILNKFKNTKRNFGNI